MFSPMMIAVKEIRSIRDTDINNIEIYMTMQTKVILKYDYPGL